MTMGKGTELVCLSNNFITNRPETSNKQTRLLYLALSKINPKLPLSKYFDKEFIEIKIPLKEVLEVLECGKVKDLKDRNACNVIYQIQANVKKMQSLVVDVPEKDLEDEEDFRVLNIFTSISFTRTKGLKVLFSHFMTPYLLELSSQPFTQILLSNVYKLKSEKSVRFLELLTMYCHKNANKRKIINEMSVDEFRNKMYIKDSQYTSYKFLKRDIINKCIEDINNIGSYHIEFEEERSGRKVETLRFYIMMPDCLVNKKKSTQVNVIEHNANSIQSPVSSAPATKNVSESAPAPTYQQAIVDMLADDEKLTDDILANRLNSLGYAEVNTRYWLENNRDKFLWAVSKTDEAVKKGKVKSYGAYLTAMLKQDVSFNNALVQAQAETYWKEKAECQVAEQEKYYREQDRKRIEKMADNSKKTVEELESSIALWEEFIIGKDQNSPVVLTVLKKLKEYRAELASRG